MFLNPNKVVMSKHYSLNSLNMSDMEPIYVENLAQKEILESNNPMGVDWEVLKYTFYHGVRLKKRKGRPDQLIFLQKYRGGGRKFSKPVIHIDEGHFLRRRN